MLGPEGYRGHMEGTWGELGGRCVVVDDLITNVLGAEAAGMRAILHQDDASTVGALEDLFGVSEAVR